MNYYDIGMLLENRIPLAMKACGIFDEEEIASIEPISYLDTSNPNHTFVTVWMFGYKKIYSGTIELIPGEYEDALDMHGQNFCDVYKYKNIKNIIVDDYGCVITMNDGEKIELIPQSIEDKEAFDYSARGLIRLWDDFD